MLSWKIVSMSVAAVGFVCAGAARFLWVQRRCRHAVRALMTLALNRFAQLFLLYIQQNGIIGLIANSTYVSHKNAHQQFGPLKSQNQEAAAVAHLD
jgi:nitrate reductase gamma subunit